MVVDEDRWMGRPSRFRRSGAPVERRSVDRAGEVRSVGSELEEEDIPNFQKFVAFLEGGIEQGNYPGLTVSSEIYAGEGHGAEGIALTYLHGIAMVYPQVER